VLYEQLTPSSSEILAKDCRIGGLIRPLKTGLTASLQRSIALLHQAHLKLERSKEASTFLTEEAGSGIHTTIPIHPLLGSTRGGLNQPNTPRN